MLVLGVETSCDETAAAVVDERYGVHANIISSQWDHAQYGGVVPELASRAHMRSIVPVIQQALTTAGTDLNAIDGVAATKGPGLVGSLIVGLSVAKAIALATDKPLIGVHHLEGHIFSNLLESNIELPFLTLLVSGGHTALVFVPQWGEYQLLGQTRDDAAGEAFDKVAKLLDLLPPTGSVMGGRLVAELAEKGDPQAIAFPRAMLGNPNLDFSFSGLKTAVLNYVRTLEASDIKRQLPDIAASFQLAVVDVLVAKTLRAMERHNVNTVALAGGVAANRLLRERMGREVEGRGGQFHCPAFEYCTDNAAMIAAAGLYHLSLGERASWNVDATPRLNLSPQYA
jgi:N6-L-threonylcarbamoyladenine synthase